MSESGEHKSIHVRVHEDSQRRFITHNADGSITLVAFTSPDTTAFITWPSAEAAAVDAAALLATAHHQQSLEARESTA